MRCFVDLDGVLANFIEGACKVHDKQSPYIDKRNYGYGDMAYAWGMTKKEFLTPIHNAGHLFWAMLNPTPDCKAILQKIESYFKLEDIAILTAPAWTRGCCEGKIQWIKANLEEHYHRNFLISKVKHFCAQPDAVLIDDSDDNIVRFREYGGKGILIPRPWNSGYKNYQHALGIIDAQLKDVTNGTN